LARCDLSDHLLKELAPFRALAKGDMDGRLRLEPTIETSGKLGQMACDRKDRINAAQDFSGRAILAASEPTLIHC
jgi:hypothetical protein